MGRMKWERLSVGTRVIAGALAGASFFVACVSIVAFLDRGGADLLERAVIALISCGASGLIFGYAAIKGRSPDVSGMFDEINSRQ